MLLLNRRKNKKQNCNTPDSKRKTQLAKEQRHDYKGQIQKRYNRPATQQTLKKHQIHETPLFESNVLILIHETNFNT